MCEKYCFFALNAAEFHTQILTDGILSDVGDEGRYRRKNSKQK